MTSPRIVLDLTPALEASFFDDELHARLNAVGTLSRAEGSDPASRMSADILITGWGSQRLPERRTDGDRLQLAVHSAGTIREIIPKSLIADGVRASHAAAGMATSVAELALVFTISLLRRLQVSDRSMFIDHSWKAAADVGLAGTASGTRIGVIGASRVGRAYIGLAKATGAHVVVSDPYLTAAEATRLGVEIASLDELLETCPVVAVHAPVTAETRGLLTKEKLSRIVDGGILINTARSAIVDTAAMVEELASGRLSAGLDVFDEEPLPSDSPLWSMPNVILTPHLGGVTHLARREQGLIVVNEIERFAAGDRLECEILTSTYDILA